MSEKQHESMSALMDGELDEMSVHRLFGAKGADDIGDALQREKWSRYHLARDVIKGDVNEFSGIDLSQSITASLESEETFEQAQTRQAANSTWWKPVAGLSVAASVAFAVVLGARFDGSTGFESSGDVASQAPSQVPALVQDRSSLQLVNQQLDDQQQLQAAQERLNSYLKKHAQDSAIGQGRTAMPFARVVNFETQQPTQAVRPE